MRKRHAWWEWLPLAAAAAGVVLLGLGTWLGRRGR